MKIINNNHNKDNNKNNNGIIINIINSCAIWLWNLAPYIKWRTKTTEEGFTIMTVI